jgi:hypothetical protein
MRPAVLTLTATGSTSPLPLDWRAQASFKVGFGGVVTTTGAIVWKIQRTFDNILDPSSGYTATNAAWFDDATVGAATGSMYGSITEPCIAVRVTSTAFTGGANKSLRVSFVQAGP